jgi:hypothetical protein
MINLCVQNSFNWIQFIAPFVTLIGIGVAIIQLSKNNKTRKADFTHRLDSEFFTSDSRICVELIYLDLIKFIEPENPNDDGYFLIDKNKVESLTKRYHLLKDFAKKRDFEISCFEIDDLLLGHFEKIGLYWNKKVVDIDFVYGIFDYYIQLTYDNNDIKNYIKWMRQDPNCVDVYEQFETIANELKKYGLKKNKK